MGCVVQEGAPAALNAGHGMFLSGGSVRGGLAVGTGKQKILQVVVTQFCPSRGPMYDPPCTHDCCNGILGALGLPICLRRPSVCAHLT